MRNKDSWKTIGHEKQKNMFLAALKNKRLGHAYVFAGPANVGKTAFALDLACELQAQPVLDVFVSDDAEGLSIEAARKLQSFLSLTPVGRIKIATIAEAEKMTPGAANSLLKTLEEPPAHSLLILTTSNFYSLLPTIASRVQRVNFGRATPDQVREALGRVESEGVDPAELTKLAGGRIGFALRLKADPQLLDFYKQAESSYKSLAGGTLQNRLLTAQMIAGFEPEKIDEFLKYAMLKWVEDGGPRSLAEKLFSAFRDLNFNLNPKLLMDDLFLP